MILNPVYMTASGPRAWLTFSSPQSFTLAVNDGAKHWAGKLEYSTDGRTWSEWDGTGVLTAAQVSGGAYLLYLCGTGNTKITGAPTSQTSDLDEYRWVLTGSNIRCDGNIETLLDYRTVLEGGHPTMAVRCFYSLFDSCTALISAPTLPAPTLTYLCYACMFYGCTALKSAPALPAMTLGNNCYASMFNGCTSLLAAPSLPATELTNSCYFKMFKGCTSLASPPALSATDTAESCYYGMFDGCTNLSVATILPSQHMSSGCYQEMFKGCDKLKLSTSMTGVYRHAYRLPASGTGSMVANSLTNMFGESSGQFIGTPNMNTTYYLASDPV